MRLDQSTRPAGTELPDTIPVGLVPTPTQAYQDLAALEALANAAPAVRLPVPRLPRPLPVAQGCRVLMWKQDPSVSEIGIRKAYLSTRVFSGPRDARVAVEGLPVVSPNVLGDMIVDPSATDAFDAVHTFAVVRQTLTLFERQAGRALPWQWNGPGNADPVAVSPHAGVTMNAYYSRRERALRFFSFARPGQPPSAPKVFTCRSLDIVAHETGHAILDGMQPGWLAIDAPPQTGGLHESFGDLAAIFLTLSQLDQAEALVAQTKANLHAKSFLSDLAEEFGLALGRANGLRNADNDLKLSQVGNEVHAISQVFTGGVYDVLADLFDAERDPERRDDTLVLTQVAHYMAGLVLRALRAAPAQGARYVDVVNAMTRLTAEDGKPDTYRRSLRERFAFREVLDPSNAAAVAGGTMEYAPAIEDTPDAWQDRSTCCGTMQLDQDTDEGSLLAEADRSLRAAFSAYREEQGELRLGAH